MINTNPIGPSGSVGILESGKAKFGDNQFLSLMIAQLQNQTPLEPVDNASFMQTMASYSSMTEQKQLNDNMLTLLDYQAVLARLQSLSEGSTLLGKEVSYISKDGDKSGIVDSIFVTERGEVLMRIGGEEIEDRDQYPVFLAKTIDNPCLPRKEVERLIREWGDSRQAKQELEGQFISIEGIVFPELREEVHLLAPPPDHEFIATVGGLDFGDASPTALLELKMDRSRKIWITREFYKRNATDDDWLNVAAEWNLPIILCDPSASEQDIRTWRMRYGVNIKAAMAARKFKERGRLWRTRLTIREDGNPGLYISPACPNTGNEMINLAHYVRKGEDDAQDKFAPGTHDHAYDAGAYGMSYFERGYIGRPQKTFELVKA